MTQPAKQFVAEYQSTLPVHLLRTHNADGEPCYFIIRSNASHCAKMRAHRAKAQVDVTEFGEVLASGYGKQPSMQVIAFLKDRYGIDVMSEGENP